MKYTLKEGDNIDTLKEYPDNHFDSIVTDPPYGIEFLGKDWDKNTGVMETWNECFRVLKPGGHLLAFSAARTYHHLATNIETAGFEIRDQLMWLYGSGFPKAQDIGKAIQKRQGVEETKPQKGLNGFGRQEGRDVVGGDQFGGMTATYEHDKKDEVIPTSPEAQQWSGWKTALKPAHEPIVMARKPFKGSCVDNVLKHGVGAMNIDESRIPYSEDDDSRIGKGYEHQASAQVMPGQSKKGLGHQQSLYPNNEGRYPSNVIGEIPDYQQFFYCPKVSRTERHIGFEKNNGLDDIATYDRREDGLESAGFQGLSQLNERKDNKEGNQRPRGEAFGDGNLLTDSTKSVGNNHPTVKPVELMKYLVKLVTPAGGKVLDPFNGSGSTGMACVELGYEFLGCELDPKYIEISTKRIEGWYEHTRPDTNFDELFEK